MKVPEVPKDIGKWSEAARARWFEARAIMEVAAAEGRDLTQAESARCNALTAEVERLCQQSRGRQSEPDAPGGTGGARRATARTADGREVRLYRPGEGLVQGQEADVLNVGALVRGMATGRWLGAEREQRALSGASDVGGGFALNVPTAAWIIDLARAKSVVVPAGAMTIPMDSAELKIACLDADVTAYWRPENVAITESEPQFGMFTMRSYTVAALAKMSVELVEDAPNAAQLVEDSIAAALGREFDRVGLMGSGVQEPHGIYGTEGVQTITAVGALDGYDKFSEAVQKIAEQNGQAKSLIMAPRTAGEIDRLKNGEGDPLESCPSWATIGKFVTTQIPITLGGGTETIAIVGDFSQLLLGLRTDVKLEVSRQAADASGSAFGKLQVWVRAYLRGDVCVSRPAHFCTLSGIVPPS